MTAANVNIASPASAATRSEVEAVMRLMAQLPALPGSTQQAEAILRLFR